MRQGCAKGCERGALSLSNGVRRECACGMEPASYSSGICERVNGEASVAVARCCCFSCCSSRAPPPY